MTYEELIDEVIAQAFPEGYASNLLSVFEKRVLDGLIEAQRWVPYLKQRQTRLYGFASTVYRQGTTAICKPAGRVKRLTTFNSRTLKDAVYYDPCSREDIDRLVAQRARAVPYPDAVQAGFGFFNASAVTDKGWRAERGIFCIDDDEIIVLPHIESTERIMVEWRGSKTAFEDEDEVDYGKYHRQVITSLENWLRWKSLGKDDRSTSDYMLMEKEWRDSIAGLQLDTKNDTEPELPLEDIGILPRTLLPVEVTPFSLGCDYDPTNAFFSSLWMLCVDNGKFYNFSALLFQNQVVEQISGNGLAGGKAEVTYETIRAAIFNLQADDDEYYKLVPHLVNGEPTHGFEGGAVDSSGASPCDGLSVINVDIQSPDNQLYYRLNLVLQNGVPTLNISGAPAESETAAPTPSACSSRNVFILKDVVTQKCAYVRIENGQFTVSDS